MTSESDGSVFYDISVYESGEYDGKTVYVMYSLDANQTRFIEGDTVFIWGVSNGVRAYTEQPFIIAQDIELSKF